MSSHLDLPYREDRSEKSLLRWAAGMLKVERGTETLTPNISQDAAKMSMSLRARIASISEEL